MTLRRTNVPKLLCGHFPSRLGNHRWRWSSTLERALSMRTHRVWSKPLYFATPLRRSIRTDTTKRVPILTIQLPMHCKVPRESKYPPLLSNCDKLQMDTVVVDRTSLHHSSPTLIKTTRDPAAADAVASLLFALTSSWRPLLRVPLIMPWAAMLRQRGAECHLMNARTPPNWLPPSEHVSKSRNKVTLELFERPPAFYFLPIPIRFLSLTFSAQPGLTPYGCLSMANLDPRAL